MDTGSWFSVLNVALVVAGVTIGAVVGHFASPSIGEAKRLRSELERMLRENETYRASVNAHFRKTADLVGHMTKSYAAVYDHLAGGARAFCDDAGPGQKLPFEPLSGALASPAVDAREGEASEVAIAEVGAAVADWPTDGGTAAADWPTDVVLNDSQDDSQDDAADDAADHASDPSANLGDSKAATGNSPS